MTIGTPLECYHNEFTTLTAATSVITLTTGMLAGTTGFVLTGSTAAKTVTSLVDSQGNTWTVDKTAAGAAEAVSICSAVITTALVGGTDTVTITWANTTSSTTDVSIQNVTGLGTTPVDVQASATGAATPAASGATSTLQLANEIAWEVNAFGSTAATPGAGFTAVTTSPIGTQTTIGYQIVSALTAVNGTFTGGTGAWAAAVATYKGTATAVTTNAPPTGSGNPAKPVVVGSDQAAKTSASRLCSVAINPTGSVTPTITIFDNASAASGAILFGPVKIQSGIPYFATLPDEGINATNGIFIHASSWTTVTVTAYVK